MGFIERVRTKSEGLIFMAIATLCIAVSLAVLISEPFWGGFPALERHIPAFTLFLLGSFVLYFAIRERVLSDYAKWKSLGIKALYRTRHDPGQEEAYSKVVSGARSDLLIVGLTLKDLTGPWHDSELLEKMRAGCKVRLLMLSPKYSGNRNPIVDPMSHGVPDAMKLAFQAAIQQIRLLAQNVREGGGTLEVRWYEQAPTLSLTVADGESPSALMRVELIPHNTPGEKPFRPMLDLCRTGGHDLLSEFYSRYQSLWYSSRQYIAVRDKKIVTNPELDLDVLEHLQLPENWLPGAPVLPEEQATSQSAVVSLSRQSDTSPVSGEITEVQRLQE